MKYSELPKGTIIEIAYEDGKWVQFELTSDTSNPDWDTNYISHDAIDELDEIHGRENIRIISVPYEVTLKLAQWLDNVYTKTGSPESLIIEAAQEIKKTKDDAHISDRPKKG